MANIQQITINVLDGVTPTPPINPDDPIVNPDVPNTAVQTLTNIVSNHWLLIVLLIAILILSTVGVIYLIKKQRGLGASFLSLALLPAIGILLTTAPPVNATSSLNVTTDTLSATITRGDSPITKTFISSTSVTTDNAFGYTMNAKLDQSPPQDITATLNDEPLTTTATNIYADNTGTSPSAYDHTLSVVIPANIPTGTYTLNVIYDLTENTAPAPSYLQDVTAEYCASLTLNQPVTLKDKRDEREYAIAKLADNHCWMLDNLKLGSETSTMALTNADTDLNTITNFTLPQLYAGNSSSYRSYDDPFAYGPVTGDTGTDETNYGYLYNWPAATAGETRTTMPGDGTNGDIAPNSICPKNWRMPTGGNYDDANNEFAGLTAAMNNESFSDYVNNFTWGSPYSDNWQFTGPFRGVFSGVWGDGFNDQGDFAFLWSSSAYSGYSYFAFIAVFDSSFVTPVDAYGRNVGFGVRCLLK